MPPQPQFTVEVDTGDPIVTDVLTRQLRVNLRALVGLSLEPVFAPMPVTVGDDPNEPYVGAPAAQTKGVIGASGVSSPDAVKNLFDLLVSFAKRASVENVILRSGSRSVVISGVAYKGMTEKLFEMEELLGIDVDAG